MNALTWLCTDSIFMWVDAYVFVSAVICVGVCAVFVCKPIQHELQIPCVHTCARAVCNVVCVYMYDEHVDQAEV